MIATRLSPFCSVREHRVPLTLLAVLDTPESFPAAVCSRSSSAKSGVSKTSSSAPLAPLAMVSTMVYGNAPSRGARICIFQAICSSKPSPRYTARTGATHGPRLT